MPVLTATKANGMRALRAIHLFRIHVTSFHMAITVWLRAESHERVAFKYAALTEMIQFVK